MKALRQTIGWAIIVVALVANIVFSVWLRFTRIDATETRLFVDYWQAWVAFLVAIAIGIALAHDS